MTADNLPAPAGDRPAKMESEYVRSAASAAMACASALGLSATDAVILQASNRIAFRLLPCDLVSRVAPLGLRASADFEVEVARSLAETASPVAALDPRVEPRVYEQDGFVINMWAYYEPLPSEADPRDYARVLAQLHAGMRAIQVTAPHFTSRLDEAQRLVDNVALSPELAAADRDLLSGTLQTLRMAITERRVPEQLLHGEPHPGNLLHTKDGLLFIDFETCCRGPVEFDLAHAPEEVSQHYPGIDRDVLRDCRLLMLAMVAAWRWDRADQFPGGRQMGLELLSQLRAGLGR